MLTLDRDGTAGDTLRLLWAAREAGLLDAVLTTAGTPAAVADAAGVAEAAARATVDALAAAGFLAEVGDEYEPTSRALGLFATRDLRSIGRLPHALDVHGCWTRLAETMATGEAPPRPAGWLRHRLGAHAATDEATVRACVTAAWRACDGDPGDRRVLDVAGGSGVLAREFLARGAAAVRLQDDPAVIDAVEPLCAPTAVDLVPVAPPAVAWTADEAAVEDGPDLVFAADLARRLPDPALATLLADARDVLAPGGVVVLIAAVRGRTADAAAVAAGTFAVHGADATVRTADGFRAAFADAGLDARLRPVPGVDAAAVVGRVDRE